MRGRLGARRRAREAPFAQRALALTLLAVPLLAATAAAELRAGAASAEITPPLGGRLYGYGARGDAVSTGVHDPLRARALVLADGARTVALVTLDLGSARKDLTREVRRLVAERAGWDDVLLLASHSHSTPTPDDARYADWLAALSAQIAGAALRAHEALRPARMAVAVASVPECHNRRRLRPDGSVEMFWRNRERLPTSPVDWRLTAVALEGAASGEPIATLVHFACHPVVLGPENLELSADYPWALVRALEAAGGGQAMFVQGAAGDINPYWDKTSPAEGAFAQAQALGERLAAAAADALRSAPRTRPERIAVHRATVPLALRWELDAPDGAARFEAAGAAGLLTRYRDRFAREQEAEVTTVLIGERLAFATFPGEFFVEHGQRLRRDSLVETTLFFGYANGELGYFPTIRAAAQGGYGATEATLVEVGAGERLVDRALIDLAALAGRWARSPTF